jgi:hypothetical protein
METPKVILNTHHLSLVLEETSVLAFLLLLSEQYPSISLIEDPKLIVKFPLSAENDRFFRGCCVPADWMPC